MSKNIKTCFPEPESTSHETVAILKKLINLVYDESESGMWKISDSRTDTDEIRKMINEKKLIVARYNNKIVGSVAVQLMEDGTTGEFGMLVSDKACRGLGVGTSLVNAAEQWAKETGCQRMRLELLTPRNWKHPSKEFDKKWYIRIGYEPEASEPFELMYPDKIDELATECDFTVWYRKL